MRDEFGSISRHGLRASRSHRASSAGAGSGPRGSDAAAGLADALEGTCWAQLPPELLREVLVRVEDDDTLWPSRRDVVACAGVCRAWRGIMKEVVRVPEASCKLTFPISLKQVRASAFNRPHRDCDGLLTVNYDCCSSDVLLTSSGI
jgi:hypothetical protein